MCKSNAYILISSQSGVEQNMKSVLHATSSAFRSYNEAAKLFQSLASDDTFNPVCRDYKKALSVIDSLFHRNDSNVPFDHPKFGGRKAPKTAVESWQEVLTPARDLGYMHY